LSDPILRERLFTELDRLCRRAVVAVIGPPGAGKTTLVASYLEARDLHAIWFQVDQGDSDAATFFYYLRLAVEEVAPDTVPPLQLLAPEYVADLAGFSRRFFRDLYARLQPSTVLVFDNFQDAPENTPFVTVMREALAEIPEHLNVVLCSRADPPPDFARFVANERMGILDWEQLRLSVEEVRKIVRSRGMLDENALRELHARSDGWAAGVTLMLEHAKRTGELGFEHAAAARGTLFNYFAGEIFNRAAPDMQQLLLCTACTGRVTVRFARSITGNAQAADLLEELYRRHYFTYRRQESEPSYAYHALFRTFLEERARSLWSHDQLRQHHAHAARLLEEAGEVESAVALYLAANDHDAASTLILREAARLLASGRWQTLGTWMCSFPQDYVDRSPWLLYWWGTSLLQVSQPEARALLQRAFRGMSLHGDQIGELLSAAGMIEAYYFEWATFRPIDPWIEAITQRLQPAPQFPSANAELNVYSALLIAMSYRNPGNALLSRLAEHVTQLLESDADVNHKVAAGTFLIGYCYFASDFARAERVIALVSPLAADPDLTPLNQLWWRARLGYHAFHLARYDEAVRALDDAREIAGRHGLAGLQAAESLTFFFKSLVAFSRNDLAAADDCIRMLTKIVKPTRRFDMWYLHFSRAAFALRQGDHEASRRHASESLAVAVDLGMIYVETLSSILIAHILTLMGRYDEALAASRDAKALQLATMLEPFNSELTLIEAGIELSRGNREQGMSLARQGLTHAQRAGYVYWFRWIPSTLPKVFAECLASGVEADYVREVIRRFAYQPPRGPTTEWPRALRITVLGSLTITQNGIASEPTQRATRKPLELLKAIIAFGAREVEAAMLAEQLWPDAEGDAAQKSLEITLHRLRKQLGSERAVTLRQGKISMDLQECWIDLSAFEHIAEQTAAALQSGAQASELRSLAVAALELYRGDLLPHDNDLAWLGGPRRRVRNRFLQLVMNLGKALEGAGSFDDAIALYCRGIEVDAQAEQIYQRLMTCYQQTGRAAEAEAAYQRCIVGLATGAQRRPSPETEYLRRMIQGSVPR
jgi:ATP/maltotriose-dependent transcriptional regulator MalT/DNA-binding SARP family transcriptional activator